MPYHNQLDFMGWYLINFRKKNFAFTLSNKAPNFEEKVNLERNEV
jgi:hypothetical protein